MALFHFVGISIGGVISPYIFTDFIEKNQKFYLSIAYYISSFLMIFASIVGYFFGVDAEKKTLEEIQ